MCNYCQDKKSITSVNWNGAGQINIDKNGILYGKDDEIFRINYCPMCGRELKGADNIE